MMRTWTNLPWPDDCYRTGQQLYRRPAARLAAFTTWPAAVGGRALPLTTAIVYLPLHRSKPVAVTGQTLVFGFRAVSAGDPAELPAVAAVADLDLMQARRHAAALAGYHLGKDLAALQQADGMTARRGLAAVAGNWADRSPAAGRAALVDCDLDLPGAGLPLGQACQQAAISPTGTGATGQGPSHPATLAVQRALVIALLCARRQGRYEWDGTLDTGEVMAAATWDCLPWPETAARTALSGHVAGPPGGVGSDLPAAAGQRQ
jgi:hypothetical protein